MNQILTYRKYLSELIVLEKEQCIDRESIKQTPNRGPSRANYNILHRRISRRRRRLAWINRLIKGL